MALAAASELAAVVARPEVVAVLVQVAVVVVQPEVVAELVQTAAVVARLVAAAERPPAVVPRGCSKNQLNQSVQKHFQFFGRFETNNKPYDHVPVGASLIHWPLHWKLLLVAVVSVDVLDLVATRRLPILDVR